MATLPGKRGKTRCVLADVMTLPPVNGLYGSMNLSQLTFLGLYSQITAPHLRAEP